MLEALDAEGKRNGMDLEILGWYRCFMERTMARLRH
jgi:hypothetical protein